MLWSIGFLTTFLFGGLTGVILASPPLDFHVSDSYFVVAHFHYVVFGTVVFAMFAGFYFWWPKLTGRMLDEKLGKIHFWLLFLGFAFHGPSHWAGNQAEFGFFVDHFSFLAGLLFAAAYGPGHVLAMQRGWIRRCPAAGSD